MATIQNVTFDCADAAELCRFWSAVLETDPIESQPQFAMIPGRPNVLFLQVPEPKSAKNRCHLDLDCADLQAERNRLEGLGATFVHEKTEYGIHWMTFTDPEGNEFCAARALS